MLADAGRWRLRARIEARVKRHQNAWSGPPAVPDRIQMRHLFHSAGEAALRCTRC